MITYRTVLHPKKKKKISLNIPNEIIKIKYASVHCLISSTIVKHRVKIVFYKTFGHSSS